MNYGYVENGVVKEGPRSLPKSWQNISGLNLLSDEELRQVGWLPWKIIETQGDILTGRVIEVFPTEIVETQTKRNKTENEITAEQQDRFNQLADSVRTERNRRLAESDWTQLPDSPPDALAWGVYRKALRDLPSQPGFPWDIIWPEAPQ